VRPLESENEENLDWLVSVDDHVYEPPNLWQDRLPSKYRDIAPRVVRTDEGEFWLYEDTKIHTGVGIGARAGKTREEFDPGPVAYSDMRPGCYDAAARIADMDTAGIISSLCFPTYPRFCGQLFWEAKDKDLALLCVKAYNDWIIEEWSAFAPGRLLPLTLIPLWDVTLAVEELQRCAVMGSTTFAFSENPEPLGLPTINDPDRYWEPLMAAANDAGMVVSMHVGSSSTMPAINKHSGFMANLAWGANRTSGAMLAWLFSGYFQAYPNLKIALSEGEVGWIPYFLERAQYVYDTDHHWIDRGFTMGAMGAKSGGIPFSGDLDIHALYLEHVYGCLIDDRVGLHNLDTIGEDNVMYETDYPHSDTTWPDCIALARQRLDAAGLAPRIQYKILRGNAERLYRFKAPVPVPA
jgi:predicted TIM-barrel fold metal-dependent hydrolase